MNKKISVSEVWQQGTCCGLCFYAPGLEGQEAFRSLDKQYSDHLNKVHPIINPSDYIDEEVKIVCRKHGNEFP